jgi:hypothetical protein
MKTVARPGIAQSAPVSDFVKGGVVGLLLVASLLLIALAVKPRPA